VMRHGQTGDAVGQGRAPGLAHGAQKGLRLWVKRRKSTPRGCGVLAAATQEMDQEKAEYGEAAHLFDHQLSYHKFLRERPWGLVSIRSGGVTLPRLIKI
jgi:hypothetical protein